MFQLATPNQRPVYVCGWNAQRLHRVVCGNIIDYAHSNGSICTHGAVRLNKIYFAVKEAS